MERPGFNRTAVTLALTVLVRKYYTQYHDEADFNGNPYSTYSLTDDGMTRPAEDDEVPF